MLLARNVEDYENIAGFYFSQILFLLISEAKKQNKIKTELWEQYIERQYNEEKIATNEGWPDSFVEPFISKKIKKNDLNKILNLIK